MSGLVDAFLAHRATWRPVDASFMGDRAQDHRLPPAGADAVADERAEIDTLLARAKTDTEAHPHDRRMILGELRVNRAEQDSRPRQANPAWATGEAAFGLIVLLLPQSAPWRMEAIRARLAAIPEFLESCRAFIAARPVPRGWAQRALSEARAMALFLAEDIRLHEAWQDDWEPGANAAAAAFARFAEGLDTLPDADPACGAEHLALVFAQQHALDMTPDAARTAAEEAFARCTGVLEAMAARIAPGTSWQDQIAALAAIGPDSAEDVPGSYRHWDGAARDAADRHGLVTPERAYGLDYRPLPACFARIAGPLYFLFYRSPPALNPGVGSVYWVMPAANGDLSAHNTATVKAIHAVHHGSVGHHTQNARARQAPSRLGRLAATDGALGLALPGALTLVEGWACHVEDLLIEAEGFYSPAEELLLKSFERRNAASVLVDVNLHQRRWTQDEAARFYAEEAGFAPARVPGEIIRNSIFPGSRATYWLGVEGIRALRRRWTGDTREFHDTLLSQGHVPLSLAAEALAATGKLNP